MNGHDFASEFGDLLIIDHGQKFVGMDASEAAPLGREPGHEDVVEEENGQVERLAEETFDGVVA